MRGKPKGIKRKDAAEFPPDEKRLISHFGEFHSWDELSLVGRMQRFNAFYGAHVDHKGDPDSDPNFIKHDGVVVGKMFTEEQIETERQACERDALLLAERLLANDAEFFERIARVLRWERQGARPVDETGWRVLVAIEVIVIRDGPRKISSGDVGKVMNELFPDTLETIDDRNIRTIAKGMGIKFPLSAEQASKFSGVTKIKK